MQPEVGDLADRPLPRDLDAERAAVGSVVVDPTVLGRFPGLLKASDFHAERYQLLFAALVSLQTERSVPYAKGESDIVILVERLKERGDYEAIGGAAAIAEIAQKTPVAAHYLHYAQIVRRFAARRYAVLMTMEAWEAAGHVNTDPVAWCRAQLKRLGKMRAWLKERGIEESTAQAKEK